MDRTDGVRERGRAHLIGSFGDTVAALEVGDIEVRGAGVDGNGEGYGRGAHINPRPAYRLGGWVIRLRSSTSGEQKVRLDLSFPPSALSHAYICCTYCLSDSLPLSLSLSLTPALSLDVSISLSIYLPLSLPLSLYVCERCVKATV